MSVCYESVEGRGYCWRPKDHDGACAPRVRLPRFSVAGAAGTWPAHQASMHLEHNPQTGNYESVEQYLLGCDNMYRFASPEARQRCIDTGELWTLQWYPQTPVGFIAVAAPTFAELMAFANEEQG